MNIQFIKFIKLKVLKGHLRLRFQVILGDFKLFQGLSGHNRSFQVIPGNFRLFYLFFVISIKVESLCQTTFQALTMEACTSTTCTKGFNDRCAVCMDRAEKFSKIQWGNMLGNSFFKENYDGWGCALDCKPKQISALGEYRGVNIFDPAYAQCRKTKKKAVKNSKKFFWIF